LAGGPKKASEGLVVIFDCNGVLVDGEQLATAIVSQEFMRLASR
jgi:beta-phosphoglucomutase-like phosphatase (HAD superfamily)